MEEEAKKKDISLNVKSEKKKGGRRLLSNEEKKFKERKSLEEGKRESTQKE